MSSFPKLTIPEPPTVPTGPAAGNYSDPLSMVQTWGWVIYRTVYTPQSDEQWAEVLKRLNQLTLSDFEHQNMSTDPGTLNAGRAQYRNFILDDKEKFDSAPFEILEQHFDEWAPTNPQFKRENFYSGTWRAFLVIDETTMITILKLPATSEAELEALGKDVKSYHLTAIEKRREPDNYEYDSETGEERWLDEEEDEYDVVPVARTWPGHFPVSLYRLYLFWRALTGVGDNMEKQWEVMQYNGDPVWLW